MAEHKRTAGIELLRTVAMVMVVIMHFLRESDSLLVAGEGSLFIGSFGAVFLEAFCIAAVNTYVLISGYFGSEQGFRLSKVLFFPCQIWFYSLLIPVVLTIFRVPTLATEMGVYGVIQYILPIETESYWFATAYFLLLLVMPLLNVAVKNLPRKQLRLTLGVLLLIACGIKSVCPIHLAFDRYGYDLFWFICLYLTGAYLKKYGGGALERMATGIYLGSCLVIGVITLGMWYATFYIDGAAYYFSVPFHYNFVFCLTAAIGLFYIFLKLELKEGKVTETIRHAGKYAFGIYLFHEHPDIRHQWYPFLRGLINPSGRDGTAMVLLELLFCVLVLFATGLIIEWVRTHVGKGIAIFLRKKAG